MWMPEQMICAVYLVPVIIAAILVLKRKDMPRAGKYLWGTIFALIAALMLFFTVGVPIFCIHDINDCRHNLQDIYFALHEYAEDHDGNLPAKLEELHPDYIDLTTVRCPMQEKTDDPLETGYYYIPGQKLDWDSAEPLLFCKNYHINGCHVGRDTAWHVWIDRYYPVFTVMTTDCGVIHFTTRDLRKYNGPARRQFLAFKAYPYDGSKPTLELVQSLKGKFPAPPINRASISMDE